MKHGHRPASGASPTYNSWKAMHGRCRNKFNRGYGGRGIRVCLRWKSFVRFLADMGERPPGTSLERKRVNGNYTPLNCIWATEHAQQRNRRNNRKLTFEGRTLCVTDWATELGIDPRRLFNRLSRGHPIAVVLSSHRMETGRKRFITYLGRTQRVGEWAKELGFERRRLSARLARGWSLERTFTTPTER